MELKPLLYNFDFSINDISLIKSKLTHQTDHIINESLYREIDRSHSFKLALVQNASIEQLNETHQRGSAIAFSAKIYIVPALQIEVYNNLQLSYQYDQRRGGNAY